MEKQKPIYRWKIFRTSTSSNKEYINHKNRKELYSLSPPMLLEFKYSENKWNKAEIGGFIVFRTREAARKYKKPNKVLKKVEVKENVFLPALRLAISCCDSIKKANDLWEEKPFNPFIYNKNDYDLWPPYTEAWRYLKVVS